MDDGFQRIGLDPFDVPLSARDRTRRFRGQLPAPVTAWTTYGPGETPMGITVSSVLVVEGDTPSLLGLVAPMSDFWEALVHSKRFVMHVLDSQHTRIADQLALRFPGDPFDGLAVSRSGYGPVLDDVGIRARCTVSGYLDEGYSLLVRASLDDAEIAADPAQPLVHYRGRYLTIGPRRR